MGEGEPAIIELLVAAGSYLEARDTAGETPLHLASQHSQSPTIIEALLDSGANGAALSADGATPWDLAQSNDYIKDSSAYWRLNDARFRPR